MKNVTITTETLFLLSKNIIMQHIGKTVLIKISFIKKFFKNQDIIDLIYYANMYMIKSTIFKPWTYWNILQWRIDEDEENVELK